MSSQNVRSTAYGCKNLFKTDSRPDTHYETLGLKEDCTHKEVKAAFVNLSKAHHPDYHPNDPSQKEKFVKIYEAYAILSKPERKVIYDADLRFKERGGQYYGTNGRVETNAPNYTTWQDESIWSMRDRTKDNFDKNNPYYGIKGIKRVSNYWIAGGAVLFMMLGTVLHYTALKHSAAFTVTQLDTRDEMIARELFRTRQTAKHNGNDIQIELLREKLALDEKRD